MDIIVVYSIIIPGNQIMNAFDVVNERQGATASAARNVAIKMNSRFFKRRCDYFKLFSKQCVGEISWS